MEPLDQTPIHPENYDTAWKLIEEMALSKSEIGSPEMVEALDDIKLTDMAEQLDIGVPTLEDIVQALKAPARDIRDDFETPLLKSDVLSMKDLKPGMQLSGTVRNVTDFGAFVDIGVKQDGLVHISKLTKRFIKHPMEVVSVGDIVEVTVLDADVDKGRISLSTKS